MFCSRPHKLLILPISSFFSFCTFTYFSTKLSPLVSPCLLHTRPIAVPSAPQRVSSIAISPTVLFIFWSDPANLQEVPPSSSFSVSCSGPGYSREFQTNFTELTVSELQPSTTYTCCVSAVNSVGRGPENCTSGQTAHAGKNN